MTDKPMSNRADPEKPKVFTKDDFRVGNSDLPLALRAKLAARAWMPKQATPEEIHNRFGYKPRKKRLKKRKQSKVQEE